MMLSEFVVLTGFEPMPEEYEEIEQAYYAFNGDKAAFCKAFVENGDNLAIYKHRAKIIEQLESRILELNKASKQGADKYEARIAALESQLDKELEWRPYEMPQNIPQADYARLAECISECSAHYMTDDEALDWVCNEFGFDRSQVTILHEIDEQEINRHNHCRASGRKIDRRPVYCATDYHYIRFNVGRGCCQWEAWNGQIHPFYD